ncbi:MAG: hypothetical protein JWO33_2760 [Caulobacteraceae bacterium]|nr:hypothetical protein [Caulobacteraceae bacterium]
MTVDLNAADYALAGLRPYPIAVTTIDNGEVNGLISLSAGAASIIPEAPRAQISLTKYTKTHDMFRNSGVFVMHLLGANPEPTFEASLQIIMALGGSSGRDGDKISQFRTKPGLTGSPILLDANSYVECRVVHQFDVDESTMFIGDIIAAERLSPGSRLRINDAWKRLPPEWIAKYERNHEPQLAHARRSRGMDDLGGKPAHR